MEVLCEVITARGNRRSTAVQPDPLDPLHARFLALLPRLELHAHISFRHLKFPLQKEEAVQEVVALAWKWFLRLAQRDKDVSGFVTAFASFAARAVKGGRRLIGQQKAKDVLSPIAQQRHGFTVARLPDVSTLSGNPYDEALQDNTVSPVPEQVMFRLDFPAWLTTRTDRDRRIIGDLMLGERTLDVARKFGLSPARVSQLRREFMRDWQLFCADPADFERPSPRSC
jgi:hypothetical protein